MTTTARLAPPSRRRLAVRRVAALSDTVLLLSAGLLLALWVAFAHVDVCTASGCASVGVGAALLLAVPAPVVLAVVGYALGLLAQYLTAVEDERAEPVDADAAGRAEARAAWAAVRDRSTGAPAGGEPGWYPDPWGAARFYRRRWDGRAWTDETDPPAS